MVLNLDELDNANNLENGTEPSNTLLTYHVTAYDDSTHFVPYIPQYKKLQNGEIVSLALRITQMKNNIITDVPEVTVVLHIRQFLSHALKTEYRNKLNPTRSLRNKKLMG